MICRIKFAENSPNNERRLADEKNERRRKKERKKESVVKHKSADNYVGRPN